MGVKELDAHFTSMTQVAGMTHFGKGISHVQQWTGQESKDMLKQILPMVVGDLKPPELTQLIWSAVDFIYRAHASSMTDSDIDELETTLETCHQLKELMIEQGLYSDSTRFNRIPKLHMLKHHAHAIRELGMPDRYNTEVPEHLHIEYAKEPWQALNKVRPLKQMIMRRWGETQSRDEVEVNEDEDEGELAEVAEVISDGHNEVRSGVPGVGSDIDSAGIAQPAVGNVSSIRGSTGSAEGSSGIVKGDSSSLPLDTTYYPNPRCQMAKAPTKPNLRLKDVVREYSASDLISVTMAFSTTRARIPQYNTLLSKYSHINIWHRLYLHHEPLPFTPLEPLRRDVVRASLTTLDAAGCVCVQQVFGTPYCSKRGPTIL
ncbi:hypothetical protein FRC06_011404, partial [Ceratobasidium sp. 370]